MSRPARTGDIAVLGVVGAAVCCGLPVLLAAGATVTVFGVGLRSWLFVFAGVVVSVAGLVLWRRRREKCDV